MTSFRIRPRFKVTSSYSVEQIRERIETRLSTAGCGCYAEMSHQHIYLRIDPADAHAWSPQLDLTCESSEQGTTVYGLYGPHPHIWTFFMLSYLALAIAAVFIGMIGMVRLNLELTAHILWALPVLAALAAALYIASQMGQKLGVEQTFRLHHFVEDVLDDKVHVK